MANRKKKRQRRPSGPATTAPKTSVEDPSEAKQAPSRGGANMARRERKEQARAAREAERKRAARHAAFRRAAVFSVVGLGAVGVLFWLQRAAAPTDLSAEAKAAASAANCSEVITPLGNATGAHVPIIAVTAGVLDSEERALLEAGYDAVVPKPFRSQTIFDLLSRHLSAIAD